MPIEQGRGQKEAYAFMEKNEEVTSCKIPFVQLHAAIVYTIPKLQAGNVVGVRVHSRLLLASIAQQSLGEPRSDNNMVRRRFEIDDSREVNSYKPLELRWFQSIDFLKVSSLGRRQAKNGEERANVVIG